jgi:RNA polymerase sigma-70 factor (ECF subfamily)
MATALRTEAATTDEPSLIQRAQQGDAEAFAALYRLHAPALYRYFVLRHIERAQAEDLTAEVFVKVIEGLARYRETGAPLAAWLFRIAHDRLVDHIRRTTRHPTASLTEMTLDGNGDPERQVAEVLELESLRLAVSALPEEQKLVIQLRFVEGYPLEATAQVLRKSVGAVKALQHRALSNLGSRILV